MIKVSYIGLEWKIVFRWITFVLAIFVGYLVTIFVKLFSTLTIGVEEKMFKVFT